MCIYICLRAVTISNQVKSISGIKFIWDQVMSFKEAAIAAAKGLVQTGDLQEMIEQRNLFMFDNKVRLSTQKNHKLLDVLKRLQDDLPSIAQLDIFVKTLDTHLLMVISKNKSKILHKQWVRANAKFAKTLLVTMKRSAKKQSTRSTKPKKIKVAALTKPPTKKKPETI